ncbi:MAG: Slp family lipoprotein [Candidatus Omnitrophica bacterium]|nr:Slp family lipoprotein [Candidatus Omnitrophota bacterium]
MMQSKVCGIVVLGLTLGLTSGCTTYPISKQLRQEANKNLTLPMVLESPTAFVGSMIIWGGRILKVENYQNRTDLYVLEMPLNKEEWPKGVVYSRGRFIARSAIFLDPEIFRIGRKITVAGLIYGAEEKTLDHRLYPYPVVVIKQIHLWSNVHPPSYYEWGFRQYVPFFWPSDNDMGFDDEYDIFP